MISTLPCTREYHTQPTASVRCCLRYWTRSWCASRYCRSCALSMAPASRVWPDSSSVLRRSSLSLDTSRRMLMSERSMARARGRSGRSSICTSSQRRISVAASSPCSVSISASISSPWSISSRPVRSSLCTRRVCDFFSREKICRMFSSEKPSIFWVIVAIRLSARNVPPLPAPVAPAREAAGLAAATDGTAGRCQRPLLRKLCGKKKEKAKGKSPGRRPGGSCGQAGGAGQRARFPCGGRAWATVSRLAGGQTSTSASINSTMSRPPCQKAGSLRSMAKGASSSCGVRLPPARSRSR